MRTRSVTSTLPMGWEGGWEWAKLRDVALDERELDRYLTGKLLELPRYHRTSITLPLP